MFKFIYAFGIILFGLSLGYTIQILVRRERIKLPLDLDALRTRLQRIALIPPSIYDLDLDLANSCWFFTTALLVMLLPVLLAVISHV